MLQRFSSRALRFSALTTFPRDFSQPDALPAASLDRATKVLQSSRLFRYQGAGKDDDDDEAHLEASRFEQEFARLVGAKYAMGLNSCGSAMMPALLICYQEEQDEGEEESTQFQGCA